MPSPKPAAFRRAVVLTGLALFAAPGVSAGQDPPARDTLREDAFPDPAPKGLDLPKPPRSNLFTRSGFELGRQMFFSSALSATSDVACSSCHRPEHGFASPRTRPSGVAGTELDRSVPTLLNRMWGQAFGWTGASPNLEHQVLRCLEDPEVMGLPVSEAAARLQEDVAFHLQFELLYREGPIESNVGRALATFVRGLMFGDTAVDRFQEGDGTALTPDERGGLWLFESKAGCWRCHRGRNFTDERFHNTGIGVVNGMPEDGRFAVTGVDAHRGAFKTPTLRGVAMTAPYMHDGSIETLEEVVDYYRSGGNRSRWLDPAMQPVQLSEEEAARLISFLRALSRP